MTTTDQATSRRPSWDTPEVEARVETILAGLSLDEKVGFVTGDLNFDYGFYSSGVDSADIPALTMADGPAGVRINRGDVHGGRATSLPAPIGLAATWDKELAQAYGDVIGDECFVTGHNVSLAPAVDVARIPGGGRTFESFGEDPLLASQIGVPVIRGIQSHPVQATIKHYAVNNQEDDRAMIDARVDERAMMEIYMPPFEAAVVEGEVASAMAAFNRVNGEFVTQNETLLTQVLRQRFGFRGWVMSDYGANHATAESLLAGLDQEQPSEGYWGSKLRAAIDAGDVPIAAVDEAARRILRPLVGLGQLETRAVIGEFDETAHHGVAQRIAEASMVLLRNNGALPLRQDRLRSLALIGPDVADATAQGGGSSTVRPTMSVSPLAGLQARLGDGVAIHTLAGAGPVTAASLLPGPDPIPAEVLAVPGGAPGSGLRAEMWTNTNFDGDPYLVTDLPLPELNLGFFNFPGFNAASASAVKLPTELNGRVSVRLTGSLTAPADGQYEISVTSLGSFRLSLDGVAVSGSVPADQSFDDTGGEVLYPYGGLTLQTATSRPEVHSFKRTLAAGQIYQIDLEYAADNAEQGFLTGAQLRLGWRMPPGCQAPAALAAAQLAAQCDAAVVVVRDYESEAADRPHLRLPAGQDELVAAVTTANPNTVVVVMTGAPVDMSGWANQAGAIVQAWFPGQAQGDALARLLLGDVNPSGRLPLTFPQDGAHLPLDDDPAVYPGVGAQVEYREGVFVGYRGYDHRQIEPAFPFGHGLSYTSFEYDNLDIATSDRGDGVAEVSLVVRNTGDRAGAETVQVYVGELPAAVPTPPKQLAAFAKVDLQPGEEKPVSLTIPRRSVSYWDVSTHDWATPPGLVPIFVGASSRDIRLTGRFTSSG